MTFTLERLNSLNHNLVEKNLALLDNFIIHYDLIYYMNQFNECDWLIYQFESWVRVLSLSEFLNRIFILF